jgi:hypothetical protein
MNLADAPRGDAVRTALLAGSLHANSKPAYVERIVLERQRWEDAREPLGVVVLAVLG